MSGADDQRGAEDARMVEEALHCAETGNAGHWPTAAGFLAEEVYRLRAELAETRAAGNALADQAAEAVRQWRTGIGSPALFALADTANVWRSAAGTSTVEETDRTT